MNPYDWQSHHPQVELPRALTSKVANRLARGGSAVVLGGRGMGKSVFLRLLRASLESLPDMRVVLVPVPPPELTVRACLDQLAEVLDVPAGASNTRAMVEAYFARPEVPRRLALLFDEFDRYAERVDQRSTNPPGRGFFNDLEGTRRDVRGLAVMATGSIGVYVVRDVLGSSFLARALHATLVPFERSELEDLVLPFEVDGRELPEEAVDALYLATGGIPALVTYGLERFWEYDRAVVERDVSDVFAEFLEEHDEYVYDLLRSVSDPQFSSAPRRVWEKIRGQPGSHSRADLEEAFGPRGESPLELRLVDVLRLLQAAGLVRFQGTALATSDPIVGYPIAGLLNLPASSSPPEDPAEHLRRDLPELLAKLHRSSADFFRTAKTRRLVPESVFAAFLSLGFELLGWHTEREAQNVSGRTDLKLRRNGHRELIVVEVKIWGRNDYKEAQKQVESYWSAKVVAGAVVMITDRELDDWPGRYRRDCLEPLAADVETELLEGLPVQARLKTRSETPDGLSAHVDHYLLRLPRRT